MGQQNVLIPYETIAAYNASQGIALYNGDSGQDSDVNFFVYWDPDTGFTGQGWDFNDNRSPAYGNESYISGLENGDNLNELFENWKNKVHAADRLAWMSDLMKLNSNCVS